ncbi:MAG: hypothetical protein KME32_06930 [Mojavia pulchra JT2-VF2]|jgi:hypothetical protein|uniref:Uncharacterized protein n=1 Tax=Mojavia pulchra JT2-VF2 TaxID=287848 RepID=A0A951UEY5_9NOST|nr:hypothetical protein [Mojavia pulchra JT2-VF2]
MTAELLTICHYIATIAKRGSDRSNFEFAILGALYPLVKLRLPNHKWLIEPSITDELDAINKLYKKIKVICTKIVLTALLLFCIFTNNIS